MKQTKTGPWVAGTVVVSLLLAAAAWFVLISPAFAAASETRVEAEGQLAQNDVTRARITQLKAQFEQMDTLQAELAALRAQVPTGLELAEYRRQIAATAAAHSVTVVALQTSPPAAVAPPVAPAPTEDVAAEGSAEAAQQPAAQPAAGAADLYAIPVSIDVLGTYPNVLAFLQDLQAAQPRLVSIASLTASSLAASDANGGKPATAPGDLGLVITGFLFAQPDPPAELPAPTDGEPAAPAPLPVPDPAKNPLVPLG